MHVRNDNILHVDNIKTFQIEFHIMSFKKIKGGLEEPKTVANVCNWFFYFPLFLCNVNISRMQVSASNFLSYYVILRWAFLKSTIMIVIWKEEQENQYPGRLKKTSRSGVSRSGIIARKSYLQVTKKYVQVPSSKSSLEISSHWLIPSFFITSYQKSCCNAI